MSGQDISHFLGFQVPSIKYGSFEQWQRRAQQFTQAVELPMLHMTLFVFGETPSPAPDLPQRVISALAPGLPASVPFNFTKVKRSGKGALLVTSGSKREAQAFFAPVAAMMTAHDFPPKYRANGWNNPHITLGYDARLFVNFEALWRWIPDELLLIESRPTPDGWHREHIVLQRWPLQPPAQGELPLPLAA